MKKLYWFLIILLIAVVVGVPFAYIVMEDWRPTIGGFFAGFRDSVSIAFTSVSSLFVTLPYWPAWLFGIAFLGGVLIARKANAWWVKMQQWGYRRTTQPIFQNQPLYQPPQPIPSTVIPPTPATPPPTLPEVKKES